MKIVKTDKDGNVTHKYRRVYKEYLISLLIFAIPCILLITMRFGIRGLIICLCGTPYFGYLWLKAWFDNPEPHECDYMQEVKEKK